MMFLVWYDDSPKKPIADKIQEAIAAYVTRFETRPGLRRERSSIGCD